LPKETQTSTEKTVKKSSDSNLLAALSYFWILSVVLYITKKDDKYIAFHAKQGIVLFIASFVMIVPFLGFLANLVIFVVALIGAIKAYQGEEYKIPVVYNIAEKINF